MNNTSTCGDDSPDSSSRRRDLRECSWTHVWTFEMLADHRWIRVWHIHGLFTSQMGWFEGPPHWSEVSIPSADLDCESLVSDLIFLHGCCVTSHWKALVHPHSKLLAQNHWCFSPSTSCFRKQPSVPEIKSIPYRNILVLKDLLRFIMRLFFSNTNEWRLFPCGFPAPHTYRRDTRLRCV